MYWLKRNAKSDSFCGSKCGSEKAGRYTSEGAGDATTEIEPGRKMPDPLGNFAGGITASWEVDIWKS